MSKLLKIGSILNMNCWYTFCFINKQLNSNYACMRVKLTDVYASKFGLCKFGLYIVNSFVNFDTI